MGTAAPMLGFLQPPYQPRPRNPTPAHLLVARYGYVPFMGREAELADLDTWSADSAPVRVRLITGPGGAGKTRLVAEWLSRQQTQAGFWKGDITEAGVTALLQAQRVLVAVDYAETRAGLALLLDRLAEVQDGQLRVVLLARHKADWWTGLKARSTEVDALLSDTMEWSLSEVDPSERAAVFRAAATALAGHRGCAVPNVQPDFSAAVFGRPLYLHMAALAAVEGLPLAADALIQGILDHEARAWMRRAGLEGADERAQRKTKEHLRRAVVALTLLGGEDRGQRTAALLKRLDDPAPDDRQEQLVDLYPDTDDRLTGLEPDLLGEALVAQALQKKDQAALLDAVVGDADHAGLVHTFSVLGRLEARQPTEARAACEYLLSTELNTRVVPAFEAVLALGEKTAFAGLAQVLTAVLKDRGTDDLARALDRRVPYPSVMLSGVGAWVEQRLMPPKGLEEKQEERARRLVDCGRWLSALGDREEALAANREAVELVRRLVASRPDAFLPDLASALNNLGLALSEIGDREGALVAARDVVKLRLRLVASHPDAFLPDLAVSLMNLGKMLSELGDREGALAATRDAVELYRRLVASRPDAFLPDLAMSLNNLGSDLSELGDREGALAAMREAVDLVRCLVVSRPDAFLPNLAMSLSNLGGRLSDLGDRGGALAAIREAVEHYQSLVATRPDAFLPDLAGSLNNLGNALFAWGDREGALAATREAVELYQRLVASHPDTFLPGLARALHNLGNWLSEIGDSEGALSVTCEAVDLYRRLVATRPDAFLPGLAMSLNSLGVRLLELGDRVPNGLSGSLVAMREAVELYRRLVATHPDAFLPGLALSLHNLGNWLSEIGDSEGALSATREAVELYRRLVATHPDAFLPGLALSLHNLGGVQMRIGNKKEARRATRESIAIYTSLAEKYPARFTADLKRAYALLQHITST